jgi:hypothetical protein
MTASHDISRNVRCVQDEESLDVKNATDDCGYRTFAIWNRVVRSVLLVTAAVYVHDGFADVKRT